MVKKILITVSKDAMRRNILETDFMKMLQAESDLEIVLVVDANKVSGYVEQFGSGQVTVVGYEHVSHTGIRAFVNFLMRTGINSHSMRTYRNRAFARGNASVLAHFIKAFISNTLGRSGLFAKALRFWYRKLKAPSEVYQILDTHQPDIILSLSGIDKDFDSEFCRAAKQRNIPLVGMVRSWDNLNNHGILPVVPDIWYFQNNFLKETAVKLQRINLKKITTKVIGLPHYDSYYQVSDRVMDRESFVRQAGLDPVKKIIMLGGSDFYYSEDTLPNLINNAIEQGAIDQPVQVVFRPHPSKLFPLEAYNLDTLKHVVLNDAFSGKTKFRDSDFFLNLLYHSDVIINIASTLSIDAAVLDKPTVCINFDDPKKNLSYYESVHRLYDHFDHYERLVQVGGVRTSESMQQLVADVNDYLRDPSLDQAGRAKIVETFVAPFDGQASFRLGQCVVSDIASLDVT